MAKKKIEYNVEDPETWTDAQMNKYIIDSVKDIGLNMPWDKIALSAVFIYGHWKAYGAGRLPTIGDVMLGVMYALTIPPALRGGLIANGYAVAALGYLGIGLIPGSENYLQQATDGINEIKDNGDGAALGFFIAGLPGLIAGWKIDDLIP